MQNAIKLYGTVVNELGVGEGFGELALTADNIKVGLLLFFSG